MKLALISLHTAPDAQPGQGDAGGLNVYVRSTAAALAARGHEIEIFTADPAGQPHPPDPAAPACSHEHIPACAPEQTPASSADSQTPHGDPNPAPEARVAWAPSRLLGPGVSLHRLSTPAATKEDLVDLLPAIVTALAEHRQLRVCKAIWAHYWISALAGLQLRELLPEPQEAELSTAAASHRPLAVSFHTIGAVKDRDAGTRREPADRLAAETRIAAHADLLVANTPAERRDIAELLGADPQRVITAVPGIDHAVYTPGDASAARHRLGLGGDPVLLTLGRMQHIKGTDVAIEAMSHVHHRLPEARLYMLGAASGTDTRSAGALAAAAAAEPAITVLPPAPAAELVDWYRSADLVLVPSRSESFGFVAAEALGCGTPVLAASVGGLRHIVTDAVGRLIAGHDPAVWGREICALLTDEERRAALGQAAPAQAAQFRWDDCVEAVLERLR